jgi:hypothetical protein
VHIYQITRRHIPQQSMTIVTAVKNLNCSSGLRFAAPEGRGNDWRTTTEPSPKVQSVPKVSEQVNKTFTKMCCKFRYYLYLLQVQKLFGMRSSVFSAQPTTLPYHFINLLVQVRNSTKIFKGFFSKNAFS